MKIAYNYILLIIGYPLAAVWWVVAFYPVAIAAIAFIIYVKANCLGQITIDKGGCVIHRCLDFPFKAVNKMLICPQKEPK